MDILHPWKCLQLDVFPKCDQLHFLQVHQNEDLIYVLAETRCYLYAAKRIPDASSIKWILKKVFKIPNIGSQLITLQGRVCVQVQDQIYVLQGFPNESEIKQNLTCEVKKGIEFKDIRDDNKIADIPSLKCIVEFADGAIICSSAENKYRIAAVKFEEGKLLRLLSAIHLPRCRIVSQGDKKSNFIPVLKVIKSTPDGGLGNCNGKLESGPFFVSKSLYHCLLKQFHTIGCNPAVLMGFADGRLLLWMPKLFSDFKDTFDCHQDYVTICHIGQAIVEIFHISFDKENSKDCIVVVGCHGRIMTISVDENIENDEKRIHDEFQRPNLPTINVKEHQISGPIRNWTLRENQLVHCTFETASKVWLSSFSRDTNGIVLKSTRLPLSRVAGLHLSKLTGPLPNVWNLFVLKTTGKLLYVTLDAAQMSENIICDASGTDLKSSMSLLHQHSKSLQELQKKKQAIDQDLEEFSNLLEMMTFQKTRDYVSTFVTLKPVYGHQNEWYIVVHFSNNSRFQFRSQSWNFCVSIYASDNTPITSYGSPMVSDLKPGDRHKFGMVLNMATVTVMKLPLKAVIGLMFTKDSFKSTYVKVSEHNLGIVDFLRIDNMEDGHRGFKHEISRLNKSRLDFQCRKQVVKTNDTSLHKMLFTIRKTSLQQILPPNDQENLALSFLKWIFNNNCDFDAQHTTQEVEFKGTLIKLSLVEGESLECYLESSSIVHLLAFILNCHQRLNNCSISNSNYKIQRKDLFVVENLRRELDVMTSNNSLEWHDIFTAFCYVRNEISRFLPIM